MTIQSEKERWEKEVLKRVTDRFPERVSKAESSSGISIPRISLPGEEDYLEKLGDRKSVV